MHSEAPPVDVDTPVAAIFTCLHQCGLLSLPPPAEAGVAAAIMAPALLGAAAAPQLVVKAEDRSRDLLDPPFG